MSGNQNGDKPTALASTASGCYVAPKRKFRMLDLFSGIGGFALAAQWVWSERLEIVSFCEIDKFCQKVLNKHWPKVPIYNDIKILEGKGWRGTIDLIVGGFPCQPFSVAGKQKSAKDDRYLWPEMLRIITETQPTWVVGENVAGIINLELDKVLADLEGAGYETITFNIPACAVDAPHRRERIWIVAYNTNSGGWNERKVEKILREKQSTIAARICSDVSDTNNGGRGQLFQQEQIGRSNESANTGGNGKIQSLADTKYSGRNGQRVSEKWGEGIFEFAGGSQIIGRNETAMQWPIEPSMGRVVNGVSKTLDIDRIIAYIEKYGTERQSQMAKKTSKNSQDGKVRILQIYCELAETSRRLELPRKSKNSLSEMSCKDGLYDGEMGQREKEEAKMCDLRGDISSKRFSSSQDMRKEEMPLSIGQTKCFIEMGKSVKHRIDRIRGLGNAVVPQVAAQILGGVALLDDAMHGAT